MRKNIIRVDLTMEEVETIVAGLTAALDFSLDYYMFAPGERNYSAGNLKKCVRMERIAEKLVKRFNQLKSRKGAKYDEAL